MKLISTVAFAAFVLLQVNSHAQNLVPNNGFEVQDTCPLVSQIDLAVPWGSATMGTPDLFNNDCSTQNGPGHTGIGSSGVYAYSTFPDNREYLQAPLISPLVAGHSYCVSMWVKRSNFRYAIDRFGVYFSNGVVNENSTGVLDFVPQVENPIGNVLGGTSWIEISGSFMANGGEDHILIGNFSDDAATDTVVANAANESKIAYYKVDDVVVTDCSVGINNLSATKIGVYPMPASNIVNVHVPASYNVLMVELMNAVGQNVRPDFVANASGDYAFDVSGLANGVYVLHVYIHQGDVTRKVIISK